MPPPPPKKGGKTHNVGFPLLLHEEIIHQNGGIEVDAFDSSYVYIYIVKLVPFYVRGGL